MALDLIPALLAAVVVAVVPGYFWASCLCGGDRAARLAYSIAFSITLVPAVALIPARFLGLGVTLTVTLFSMLTVFLVGLALYLRFGPAKRPEEPVLPPPAPFGLITLILVLPILGLVLAMSLGMIPIPLGAWLAALLVLLSGIAYVLEGWGTGPDRQHAVSRQDTWPLLRRLALPGILVLVLGRAYLGPVLHDWPYLRGTDQFNHGVMANQMLAEGAYERYLVYPPGFHTVVAGISRLSDLRPLEIFPVLAPAFLILPCLALYALAYRLWGWGYGVTAAGFAGLLLGSTYENFADARYPNFISAQFLLVLAVAALIGVYAAPSFRTGAALALLGSSVVLIHPVGSFYVALLLGLVGIVLLPYLLFRRYQVGITLLLSLVSLGAISMLYAWNTYDLGRLISSRIAGSESGAGGAAVSQAIGTQPPLPLAHLPVSIPHPVLWLGLLGAAMLVTIRVGTGLTGILTKITLLLWGAMLFVGSRTALSGFPERFERDLGIPLALFAALSCVTVLRSVRARGVALPSVTKPLAAVAAFLAILAVTAQAVQNFQTAAAPTAQPVLTPELAAAGEWLRENNTGGNIVAPPYIEGIPVRAVLAMGGYTELQTYRDHRVRLARSLPPTGAQPLWDGLWLIRHPEGERSRRIVEEHDIRYIVLHKPDPSTNWRGFVERDDLYQVVYENSTEIILAPRRGP